MSSNFGPDRQFKLEAYRQALTFAVVFLRPSCFVFGALAAALFVSGVVSGSPWYGRSVWATLVCLIVSIAFLSAYHALRGNSNLLATHTAQITTGFASIVLGLSEVMLLYQGTPFAAVAVLLVVSVFLFTAWVTVRIIQGIRFDLDNS